MVTVDVCDTPNPETRKFVLSVPVSPGRSFDLTSQDEAQDVSLLAWSLLKTEGVERVFLGGEFLSISKMADQSWESLQPVLIECIHNHLNRDLPIVNDNLPQSEGYGQIACDPRDAKLVQRIQSLIEERVRPVLDQDGGDIVLRGFEGGVVYVEFRGACVGCPASSATLKMGLENLLCHYIEEVSEVRAIG